MGNYELLKAAINEVIKANGRQEITGEVLNQVLLSMVNSLGAGYQCMGVATPSTNPGTPDQNVFYFATQAGTYTNFDAIVLQAGISVLIWDGDWASQTWFTVDATPTNNSQNLIASGAVFNALKLDGGAYDVSAHNSGATFASLSALLNSANLNILIPSEIRHGGMSIKFVLSSDNKYVQWRLTADEWSTAESDWQGVKKEPIVGSKDFVEGGGIFSFVGKESSLFPLLEFNTTSAKENELSIPSNRTPIYILDSTKSINKSPIVAISVHLTTDASFSLYKGSNIGLENYSESLIESFDGKAGWNIFCLQNPIILSENESLGTRTTKVGFYYQDTPNYIGITYANISGDVLTWVNSYGTCMPFFPLTKLGGLVADMMDLKAIGIEKSVGLNPVFAFNPQGTRNPVIGTDDPSKRTAIIIGSKNNEMIPKETPIFGILVNFSSVPTSFTLYKCSGIGTQNYSETLIGSFKKLKAGWNTFMLNEPVTLNGNESLGTRTPQVGFYDGMKTGTNEKNGFCFATISNGAYSWWDVPGVMPLIPLTKFSGGIVENIRKATDEKSALSPLVCFNTTQQKEPSLWIPSNRTAVFIYDIKNFLKKSPIYAVSVHLTSAVSFTLYKGTGLGTSNHAETLIATYEGKEGWNTFTLPEPITLGDNEGIGTRTPEVGFYYGTELPDFLGITYADTSTHEWAYAPKTCMPLFPLTKLGGCEAEIMSITKKFAGKKVSIMGDSISTYSGIQPSENLTYYPAGNVNSYDKTWSGILLQKSGMILDTLQCWSGATIAERHDPIKSFVDEDRWKYGLGNPDVIIIYGGTNDVWGNAVDVGTFPDIYNYIPPQGTDNSVEDTFDLTKFTEAYLYLLIKLKKTYPRAIIYACSTTDFNRVPYDYYLNGHGLSKQIARDIIEKCANITGCRFIDLMKCGISYFNNADYAVDNDLGGLHPNFAGMELIADYINEHL